MKLKLPSPVRAFTKRMYSKITLNCYTSLYFTFTLLFYLILSALQGVLFWDNAQAVGILRNTVESANLSPHIAFIIKEGGDLKLQVCDGTPGNTDTSCEVVANLSTARNATQRRALSRRTFRRRKRSLRKRQEPKEEEDEGSANSSDEEEEEERENHQPTQNSGTTWIRTVFQNSNVRLTTNCAYALSWLENTLYDSEREDIAILFYQLWMLTLGFVTVVNESLPHLGAGILAHVLGGAWSASRVRSTKSLVGMYRDVIVPDVCNNRDLLGSWWEVRMAHTIPIVVINAIAILLMGFLSWKLFRVYASQSFSTVGASNLVQNMYKLVLLLSVGIQMAGFFALASAALWINKITTGHLRLIVEHENIYLALFIVYALLTLPWTVLGWRSVRKESKRQFGVFLAISVVLIVISGVMFASALYRTLFRNWNFFAIVIATAFIFLVLTTMTAVLCRLNFGKGLAQYPQVHETLGGVDVTPVTFDRRLDLESRIPSPIGGSRDQELRLANENPFLSSEEKEQEQNSSSPPLISDLPPVPQVPSRLYPSTGNSSVTLLPAITIVTTDFNTALKQYNDKFRGTSLYSAVEYSSGTANGGRALKVMKPPASPSSLGEFQSASPPSPRPSSPTNAASIGAKHPPSISSTTSTGARHPPFHASTASTVVRSHLPSPARTSTASTGVRPPYPESTSTASTGMGGLTSRFSANTSENDIGGGASNPPLPNMTTSPGLRSGDRTMLHKMFRGVFMVGK